MADSGEKSSKKLSQADQIDRDLAREAIKKRQSGETPSPREAAALRKIERASEEERRWEYYRTIPQKHWKEMSGRQTKILQEQAELHGIPFAGKTIDLPTVVKAIHDFFARNKFKLASNGVDDPLLAGGNSPALEEYRRYRAGQEKIKLSEMEKNFVEKSELHSALLPVFLDIRRAQENLQLKFGNEAGAIIGDVLDDAQAKFSKILNDDDIDPNGGAGPRSA